MPVQNYTNHVTKSATIMRYGLCGDIRTGEIEELKRKTLSVSVGYKKDINKINSGIREKVRSIM